VERNRIWVVVKCFPPSFAAASLFYTLARYVLQLYAAVTGRGAAARIAESQSPAALAAILVRAWGAALAGLPEMLRRRRRIEALRRISRGELGRLLRGHRVRLTELALKD
jgi:hypothetical protein